MLLAGRPAAQCSSEVFAQPYGAGTPGALGVPELGNAGAPILGVKYHVELRDALPSERPPPTPWPWRRGALALADVNGDAALDVVACMQYGVSVLLGTGYGTFSAPRRFASGVAVESVSIGDLSGDGAPDVAAAGVNFVALVRSLLLE